MEEMLIGNAAADMLREARARLSPVLQLQDWARLDAPRIMLEYSRERPLQDENQRLRELVRHYMNQLHHADFEIEYALEQARKGW